MKKIIIGALSLLTIGFGLQVEQISLNPSNLLSISEAEARGGGRGGGRGGVHRGGGRRGHNTVNVNVNHRRRGRGGAFVAGALVGAAVVAIGSRHTYLPAGCPPYDYYGRGYYYCGDVYYQPVYSGSDVVYVVVDKP
jgi:hypothetical protein